MATTSNLQAETVDTLRAKAEKAGISGVSHMRKDELIAEIEGHFASAKKSGDAISLLEKDHAEVKALFKKALSQNVGNRSLVDITHQIIGELRLHTEVEEQLFYPALKQAAERNKSDEATSQVLEAYVEHDSVQNLIDRLLAAKPSDESYKALVQVMSEQVEHHVEEEETEMFKQAKELLSKEELRNLGQRIQELKSTLKS